jgi:hypothetical protein
VVLRTWCTPVQKAYGVHVKSEFGWVKKEVGWPQEGERRVALVSHDVSGNRGNGLG